MKCTKTDKRAVYGLSCQRRCVKDVASHFIDVSCTVAMCFTCGLVRGYLVAPLSVKRFAFFDIDLQRNEKSR